LPYLCWFSTLTALIWVWEFSCFNMAEINDANVSSGMWTSNLRAKAQQLPLKYINWPILDRTNIVKILCFQKHRQSPPWAPILPLMIIMRPQMEQNMRQKMEETKVAKVRMLLLICDINCAFCRA
jgi:hypothetical protein